MMLFLHYADSMLKGKDREKNILSKTITMLDNVQTVGYQYNIVDK